MFSIIIFSVTDRPLETAEEISRLNTQRFKREYIREHADDSQPEPPSLDEIKFDRYLAEFRVRVANRTGADVSRPSHEAIQPSFLHFIVFLLGRVQIRMDVKSNDSVAADESQTEEESSGNEIASFTPPVLEQEANREVADDRAMADDLQSGQPPQDEMDRERNDNSQLDSHDDVDPEHLRYPERERAGIREMRASIREHADEDVNEWWAERPSDNEFDNEYSDDEFEVIYHIFYHVLFKSVCFPRNSKRRTIG